MGLATKCAVGAERDTLVVRLQDVVRGDLPRIGGKGAGLGALARAGFPVPPGFCVTTTAYARFTAALPDAEAHFARLEALDGADLERARAAATAMRAALAQLPLPPSVASAVASAHDALGTSHPLAVRSSATAEDLPEASFAGQQDTFLNVRSRGALLDAVKRCWISLFTDRAVLYRARGGFGHRDVRLAVVVQRLVDADASGILFTADPVSGHRRTISIDAGFGLGEALVGGLVSADLYQFDRRRRAVTLARPGDKTFAMRPSDRGGGTRREPLPTNRRHARVLDDAQVRALAELGERVEALAGGVPQDIEWCLAKDELFVVQARPITSLFPVPAPPPGDDGLHVYESFGHIQMMTEPMPRLAHEAFAYFLPAGKGRAPGLDATPRKSPVMVSAAGRIFVDVTGALRVRPARSAMLGALGHVYVDAARALRALCAKPEFAAHPGRPLRVLLQGLRIFGPIAGRLPALVFWLNPTVAASEARRAFEAIQAGAVARIRGQPNLGARVRRCAVELNGLFAQVRRPLSRLFAAIVAHRLLARLARGAWADGVRDQVDLLLRGLPGNVTTTMDLEVGDLADVARPHPPLVALLCEGAANQHTPGWCALREGVLQAPGGVEFCAALDAFLARYGDRAVGEIDLSRPRWREDPSLVLRAVGGALASGEVGAHRRKHRQQVAEGDAAALALVEAAGRGGARGLPRRFLVGRLVRLVRSCLGLREHPKFMLVRIFGAIRAQALEAGALLAVRGQLDAAADAFFLGFDELARAVDDASVALRGEVAERKATFGRDRAWKPPLVISSDGETPAPQLEGIDLPAGALTGTAASKGVFEGVARVVTDPTREVLRHGEILVAPFTDPGWTPLFIHAGAVVTEVGGLMTHGAVVAREYGIPAVVSVHGATERIRSGQRLRVDGTSGLVVPLPGA